MYGKISTKNRNTETQNKMYQDLIGQGLVVTAVGMLVVFTFLLLLVFSTEAAHLLIPKFAGPEKEEEEDTGAVKDSEMSNEEEEIAVAIAVARSMS